MERQPSGCLLCVPSETSTFTLDVFLRKHLRETLKGILYNALRCC